MWDESKKKKQNRKGYRQEQSLPSNNKMVKIEKLFLKNSLARTASLEQILAKRSVGGHLSGPQQEVLSHQDDRGKCEMSKQNE